MGEAWSIQEALTYYRNQDAARDQQVLIAFLREVQAESGGVIPAAALNKIAAGLDVKLSYLSAVIKRCPSLRTQEAPHLLELCGGERCGRRNSHKLRTYIESTYSVKNGDISTKGGFSYRVTGCMKNCPKGPNLKWDGTLYPGADLKLIKNLIEK